MKIIKIGALWCPACLVMKKAWKNILDKYNDLNIQELDYDMDYSEVTKYNSGKILPVVIFLDNDGNELERIVGEVQMEVLEKAINKYR